MDWFLYDNGLRHERVKRKQMEILFRSTNLLRVKLIVEQRVILPYQKRSFKKIDWTGFYMITASVMKELKESRWKFCLDQLTYSESSLL